MKAACVCALSLALGWTSRAASGSSQEAALTVEDVLCKGNATVSCEFIRHHLHLSAGQAVNEAEIAVAKLKLSALPNLQSVDIHLEKGSHKGAAVIVIEVVETDPLTTNFVLGTSYRFNHLYQAAAGELTDRDLLGSGKQLDAQVAADVPFNQVQTWDYHARLRYLDPYLFGASRYFLTGGVSYLNSRFDSPNGDTFDLQQLGIDLSIGRRLGGFSYLTTGYRYLPVSILDDHFWTSNGHRASRRIGPKNVVIVTYGAHSEDNPYFPTSGGRFDVSAALDPRRHVGALGLDVRYTWSGGSRSFWTLRLGQPPEIGNYRQSFDADQPIAIVFARDLRRAGFSGIRRGRWYLEMGLSDAGYTKIGSKIREVGLKAGIRVETRSLGLLNFYLMGSALTRNPHGE